MGPLPLTGRRFPSRHLAILVSAIALQLGSAARADVAHLRNGRTMEVSGYRLEGERIILMIEGGGELSLETRQVLSIQKSGAPRSDPGRDQTLGLPPTSGGGEPATEPNPPSPEPARTMSRPLTVGAPSDPATGAVLRRSEIEGLAAGIARKYAVEERLVLAVIEVESRFDARAVSPRGAIGLMQLMPETAARFAIGNPYDPTENIDGGVRYLKELLDRYSGQKRLALAAYNAGEEAVERWSGIPPFRETILYVDRVLRALRR